MIFGLFIYIQHYHNLDNYILNLSKNIELSTLYIFSVILNLLATYIQGRIIKIITFKFKHLPHLVEK